MRKISLYLGSFLGTIWGLGMSIYAATSQNSLTNVVKEIIPNASPNSGKTISYLSIAQEVQEWIFVFVGIIAVIYIIWVGAKLIWAPGNTEEITTAMKSLGYIVIGLAIIPFAWFIISFIIRFSI